MPAKAIDVQDTALQPHFLITGDKTVKADAKRKFLAYRQRPDRSSVIPAPMALSKVRATGAVGLSVNTQMLLKRCIVCTNTKDVYPTSGPVATVYQKARQNFCRLARPVKMKALQQVNKNFPPPEGHRWKQDLQDRFHLLLCPECASKPQQQLLELLKDGESPATAVVPVTPLQPTSGVSPINLTSFVFATMAEDRPQWDFKIEDLPQETMTRLAAISMPEKNQAVFAEYQKKWHQKWDIMPAEQRRTERIFSDERIKAAAGFHCLLRGRDDFEGKPDMEVAFTYFKDFFSGKNTDLSLDMVLARVDDEAGNMIPTDLHVRKTIPELEHECQQSGINIYAELLLKRYTEQLQIMSIEELEDEGLVDSLYCETLRKLLIADDRQELERELAEQMQNGPSYQKVQVQLHRAKKRSAGETLPDSPVDHDSFLGKLYPQFAKIVFDPDVPAKPRGVKYKGKKRIGGRPDAPCWAYLEKRVKELLSIDKKEALRKIFQQYEETPLREYSDVWAQLLLIPRQMASNKKVEVKVATELKTMQDELENVRGPNMFIEELQREQIQKRIQKLKQGQLRPGPMHRVDGHKTWITHDDLLDYYNLFKIKKEFNNALQKEVAREHEQNPPQMYPHQSYQDLRKECLKRRIRFNSDDPVFRDYESRLIRQLQFSRGLELYHVATEDMCKDMLDGSEYQQQLIDMLKKADRQSYRQQILKEKLHKFLFCVPSEWLYTQAQRFKISVFTPQILVPQLLDAMTTATELHQLQANLFQNADVSELNIMRLCLQHAPGDDLSAKISCLQNIDSGQDKKWLNMCITDIVGAAVIENLSRTCDGDMLASVFQEIQRTFCEKLVSVLPQFQTAYERTMVYCADLNRKLQEALPKAQYFHFSGIFKCSEDVKNLNLNAMYDEAMCKILLDKTQATNLGIFLNDSAILHQYSRMSGKDLEDWVQRVLSFSNTTTSNPESLYPYPLLFSEQIKQFRLQQGIEKKQRRQKGSSFANSAHLERRALSDVQKCVDYLVMKTEDPTREHQWELDRVGA